MRHTTVPKAISSTLDHAFNRFAVHGVGKGPCEKYSRQNIKTIILIIAIIRILIIAKIIIIYIIIILKYACLSVCRF